MTGRFFTALAATVSLASLGQPVVASANTSSMTYADEEVRPDRDAIRSGSLLDYDKADTNAIERELLDAAHDYNLRWGWLPQLKLTYDKTLRPGDTGQAVADLRERLGLVGSKFDAELVERIGEYRAAHGLAPAPRADEALFDSLNKGHAYYMSLIEVNLERAHQIPADPGERYILVNTATQMLTMYEQGKPVDDMRVVVGKETDPTPMLAGLIDYTVVNPYWNVPPDLTRRNIAPKFLDEGMAYWNRAGFEALSDWTDEAEVIPAEEIDWKAVAAGDIELRVRQKPGPGNGMGAIKFMFPNEYGVYLHDTPSRDLFKEDVRMFSAGCVRLEDAWRLAKWVYGEKPDTSGMGPETRVDVDKPVPVYISYFTATPTKDGFAFRDDIYDRDSELLAMR